MVIKRGNGKSSNGDPNGKIIQTWGSSNCFVWLPEVTSSIFKLLSFRHHTTVTGDPALDFKGRDGVPHHESGVHRFCVVLMKQQRRPPSLCFYLRLRPCEPLSFLRSPHACLSSPQKLLVIVSEVSDSLYDSSFFAVRKGFGVHGWENLSSCLVFLLANGDHMEQNFWSHCQGHTFLSRKMVQQHEYGSEMGTSELTNLWFLYMTIHLLEWTPPQNMFVEYMIIHLLRVSIILNHTLLVHIGIQPRFGGVGSWDSLMSWFPKGKSL